MIECNDQLTAAVKLKATGCSQSISVIDSRADGLYFVYSSENLFVAEGGQVQGSASSSGAPVSAAESARDPPPNAVASHSSKCR